MNAVLLFSSVLVSTATLHCLFAKVKDTHSVGTNLHVVRSAIFQRFDEKSSQMSNRIPGLL